MSKKALEDKDYEPDEEDETSTEDLSTDSGEEEEDSDLENMDEQESQVRSGFEDAQPWPSELSQYMSPNIEPKRKEEINDLYHAYRNSQTGEGATPPKQVLVKITKLFAHMAQKPPSTNAVKWFTTKCEELVPIKKKKRKQQWSSKNDGSEVLSPPASIDLSASIIPPPPPSVEEIIEVPATSSKEGETPKKKAKLAFELDTMTQAFREGRETYNGFKITQHPKIKRKKKNDDPDEKDITGGYALDEDSYM